jgi:hypothetical protein
MAFDPSIISQIPDFAPNPVAAKEEGIKLADMQTRQTANKLTLGEQQKEIADRKETANTLKGTDFTNQKQVTEKAEKLTQEGHPDEAMALLKAQQGLQSGKGALELQKYQLLEEKSSLVANTVGGLVNQYQSLVDSGVSPTLAQATMQPKYLEAIKQLHATKLADGTPALDDNDIAKVEQNPNFDINVLRPLAESNKNSAAALKVQLDYHKQQTEDKREKNQEEQERINNRRADIEQQRADTQAKTAQEKEEARKSGLLDDEDLQFKAKQYLAGDKSVMTGLGRGAAGSQNMANMSRAIRQEAKEEGLSPQDVAARMGEFAAFVAEERSRGTREAQISIAAKEAENVFPIAEAASDKVPRAKWVPPNIIMQNFEKWHSDADLSAFAQAIDSTINVYGRAISPTGVSREAANQRALQLLSTATDQKSFESVIGIMRQEIKAALDSPDQVRDSILASFAKGVAPKPGSPAATKAAAAQTPPAVAPGPAPPGAGGTPAGTPGAPPAAPAAPAAAPAAPGVDPKLRAIWMGGAG